MSKMDDLERGTREDTDRGQGGNSLGTFFVGVACLAIGLYMVFQATDVGFFWHSWYVGLFRVPTGMVVIPLFIGIILLFYKPKSIVSWLVAGIGTLLILVTIIMSVDIVFRRTSLFSFVMMFGFILAGIGLLLKTIFFRPKSS